QVRLLGGEMGEGGESAEAVLGNRLGAQLLQVHPQRLQLRNQQPPRPALPPAALAAGEVRSELCYRGGLGFPHEGQEDAYGGRLHNEQRVSVPALPHQLRRQQGK
ncbi:unnamed protein product, partial [Closterium sp. Naga37s-1]